MNQDREAAIQAAMKRECGFGCIWPQCGCVKYAIANAIFATGVESARGTTSLSGEIPVSFARSPVLLPKDVPAGFVRVRIAVVVNHEPDGSFDWFAIGRPGASDGQLSFDASYDWPMTARVAFITADVPRPDAPAEVAGQVEVPNAE